MIPASDLIFLPAEFNLPAPRTAIRKIHLAFGEDGAELRAERHESLATAWLIRLGLE